MIKIGIVGCGFMGRMHGNVYRGLDCQALVACVDNNSERAGSYAADFGCNAYSTLEAMLGAEDLDTIDICLPTYLHKEFTIQAANAGMNVFCEKPMALTVADADEMIAACESAHVTLMIGHCIRFWPEYALLKKMIDDRTLGKLLSINLTRYGAFPSWASDNWLADESKAGGGALDMHIHDTDYAHYILGTPDSIVSHGTVDQRGVSQIFTTMMFGDVVAHLEGGWNLPAKTPFKMAFRAIFERGLVMMDGGPMTIFEEGHDSVVPEFPRMQASGGGNISDLGGYFHELKYFEDRVAAGLPMEIVTPQSSRQSLATALEEIAQVKARHRS